MFKEALKLEFLNFVSTDKSNYARYGKRNSARAQIETVYKREIHCVKSV